MRTICERLVTRTTTTTTVRTIFFDVPRAARMPVFKLAYYKDSYQNPPLFKTIHLRDCKLCSAEGIGAHGSLRAEKCKVNKNSSKQLYLWLSFDGVSVGVCSILCVLVSMRVNPASTGAELCFLKHIWTNSLSLLFHPVIFLLKNHSHMRSSKRFDPYIYMNNIYVTVPLCRCVSEMRNPFGFVFLQTW